MWKTVQAKAGIARPVQLILDMKVRWSSTYLMLDRAERNKALVDIFVDELRWEESDGQKQDRIRVLKLNNDEWERVNMFLGLLTVCSSCICLVQITNTADTLLACQ